MPPWPGRPIHGEILQRLASTGEGAAGSELCSQRIVSGLKRLRGISSKENAPGLDTGVFTYEGYLTRGAVLPLTPSQPWDWLAASAP